MKHDDQQVRAQEAEYEFPYHYIPGIKGRKFSSTRHWDWGFRYLGGMQLAVDQLGKLNFASLLDVGCGDGRFLREVGTRFPGKHLLGIDASARAVLLAQALNPHIEYRALSLSQNGVGKRFDVTTLIEVIEHIPPDELPGFMGAIADTLVDDGTLVLTVPHRNKPVIEKHYQHFTGEQLTQLLSARFTDIRLIPFDVPARRAPLMWLIERVLGGKGKWFVFTQQRILYLLYRLYLKRYLYAPDETRCERIAVVCVKKKKIG